MKVPLFKIHNTESDVKRVSEVIKRGSYWAQGPEIEEFEKEMSIFTGIDHAVAFNSGTSAQFADLIARNIKGREIIVPSFTFISTVNTIELAGYIPVFAEIEKETYCLDAESVKKKINEKTAAISLVHYAGSPARDTIELSELAEKKDISLMEDCAESLGARFGGKLVGRFGSSAMFSFCQNKIITTGEGGMIMTNDEGHAERLRLIRSHGRKENENYFSSMGKAEYVDLGYNFRMPSMVAALGISQLERIDEIIDMRSSIAKKYYSAFSGISQATLPVSNDILEHVFQLYSILLDSKKTRDELKEHLSRKGIAAKVYFDPVHMEPYYRDMDYSLPGTEDISERILSLPIYPDMRKLETDLVIHEVLRFFENK